MNKNTIRFGAAFFALIITTAVGVGYTLAHGKWGGSPEKRAEVKEAIDNNDYDAFVNAVGEDSTFGKNITEDNFSQFVQAKNLIEEGNKEEAKTIFEELGIKKGFHKGYKKGFYDPEKHEAINLSIESNDYNAWVEANGDYGKFGDSITEENFSEYARAITLKKEGDYEGAKLIFEELGITKSGKHHYWNK